VRQPGYDSLVATPRRPQSPRIAPRPKDAHKASVGRVLVVGGSPGMAGAPALAARGALRAGAGLVTIAVPASVRDVVAGFQAEAMTAGLPTDAAGVLVPAALEALEPLLAKADAVVVGPGLGRSPRTADAVRILLASLRLPVVLDADGLDALRGRLSELDSRGATTVLTPHEGEAEALLEGGPVPAGASREARAAALARAVGGVCVLKGPGTVVSDGERTRVNATGGPVLATGGTGDVLSGVVAAFLAGLPGTGGDEFGAACLAVHVHGAAGDLLAKRRGDRGVLASDVADAVPDAIRALAKGRSR
jgi:NAD(P)H-hydrate epimerase